MVRGAARAGDSIVYSLLFRLYRIITQTQLRGREIYNTTSAELGIQ